MQRQPAERCASLAYCHDRGVCVSRDGPAFCLCIEPGNSTDCSGPVHIHGAPRDALLTWPWIVMLVILFVACVICVILATKRVTRYPRTSPVIHIHPAENDEDPRVSEATVSMAESQKVVISVHVNDE